MISSNNILYTRRLKTETRGVVGWTDLLERRARRLAYKRWWNSQHPGHWKAWPSTSNVEARRKRHKAWKKANPEKVREMTRKHHRKMVENVSINWLRSHWKNKWNLTNVPAALLETAAVLIKIQREIKQQSYGNTKEHRGTPNRPSGRVSVGKGRPAPCRAVQGNDKRRRKDHRHAQAGTRILHAAEGITKHRVPKLSRAK